MKSYKEFTKSNVNEENSAIKKLLIITAGTAVIGGATVLFNKLVDIVSEYIITRKAKKEAEGENKVVEELKIIAAEMKKPSKSSFPNLYDFINRKGKFEKLEDKLNLKISKFVYDEMRKVLLQTDLPYSKKTIKVIKDFLPKVESYIEKYNK